MIEPEDLEPSNVEFDRNFGTDSRQTQERIEGENFPNPIAEDRVNSEKLVPICLT